MFDVPTWKGNAIPSGLFGHSIAINGDHWPSDARLSDIEPRFICGACGHRGADVRPDFNWNRTATAMMGYR